MSLILTLALSFGAALFVGVSATMNALFLSSLGRTPVEVGLLAAVSVAADIVKATLPVVIARTVARRAWTHAIIGSVMLVIVVALSVTSGTGFAALTRSQVVTQRDGRNEALAMRLRELRDAEASLQALTPSRFAAVVEASIAAMTIDRRWQVSRSCVAIGSAHMREFCGEVAKLRAELAVAQVRERLTAERRETGAMVEQMRSTGAGGESDPQAGALAALFGVDKSMPRLFLPVSVAIVVELGAVILILLLAGPAVANWKEPGRPMEPAVVPRPVTIPISPPLSGDAVARQLAKNRTSLGNDRGGAHAR